LRHLPLALLLIALAGAGCRPGGDGRTSVEAARGSAPTAETFQSVVDAVLPAIVFIQAEGRLPDGLLGARRPDGEVFPLGVGSGVIYSPDGYILTNNHVVQEADRVTVMLYDRRQFEARVVARDPSTDVAVVQVEGNGFPHAPLGDSDAVRLGDWVLALGSPLGLEFTVTAGIVSGTGRALGILGSAIRPDEAGAAPLEHFIQTDAAINPGNSGGPLVSMAGEVVGINTAIASPGGGFAGYGFAIPSNLARNVADQLVRHGEVRRPYMGVGLDNVTAADAEVYGLGRAEGAEVKTVEAGGPAAQAGIRVGDVILGVGDRGVGTVSELQALLAALEPGSTVPVRLVRFGDERQVPVRLGVVTSGVRPEPRAAPEGPGRLDFAMVQRGGNLVVADVRPFSAAMRAGVRPGQVILTVNRREVSTPADVVRALDRGTGNVVSLVVRDPQIGETIVNYRLQ
jgi:serine protease Do